LWGSLGRHVQALAELAAAEGREAAALYLRLAVMLLAAIILAVFGYVLLLFFLAFLLAMVFSISWIWISLGFAILHLLLAFVCALHVRGSLRTPVFTTTARELRSDFEALKSPSQS
jgi:uncharacterized membrane protein YqjE